MDKPDIPPLVPSGTPVVGSDGELVGRVVATEPRALLVEENGTAGDAHFVHVPQEAVADVGEDAVVLAATRDVVAALEQERAELVAELQAAHLTPDRARLLRALLDEMGSPADDTA